MKHFLFFYDYNSIHVCIGETFRSLRIRLNEHQLTITKNEHQLKSIKNLVNRLSHTTTKNGDK